MPCRRELYIGLMSGTSADSIDAALVDFAVTPPLLVAQHELALETELKQRILQLCQPGANEIDRMGQLDRELATHFAQATIQLLTKAEIAATDIIAIGSHGQTIRHRPPGQDQHLFSHPFTLQITDPNTLAELTGITTVADFRRRDIAAGGQGAPLTPAFHADVFANAERQRFIVNIGGMSNITQLTPGRDVIGFDTGPGNVLMDSWINLNQGLSYDRDGSWAASGTIHTGLLATMLRHPFLQLNPPKSTGRESFNLTWLESLLDNLDESIAAADVQATLLEFTALSISNDLYKLKQQHDGLPTEVFVCGGGAYNQQLMNRLRAHAQGYTVCSTTEIGIAPEWVEAMAFAWLARQTLNHKPGNLASVTGASGIRILGGIYYP